MAVDEALYKRLKDAGLPHQASLILADKDNTELSGGLLGGGEVTTYPGDSSVDYYAGGGVDLVDDQNQVATQVSVTPLWVSGCDYSWGNEPPAWATNTDIEVLGSSVSAITLSPGLYTLSLYLTAAPSGQIVQVGRANPGSWFFYYELDSSGAVHIPLVAAGDDPTRLAVRLSPSGDTTPLAFTNPAVELERHASF